MLRFHRIPQTNILELTISGGFTAEDFDHVVAETDRIIAECGEIRLLEIIGQLDPMEPAAVWKDLRFAPQRLADFKRVAVVADQPWIQWMTSPETPFRSAEVRIYPPDQLLEARQWLSRGKEVVE